MDLEELNKSQIVLLVLLVSFVTSIATGIVTVSLLAQAPPAVTQTVNRVIERTVETVVPSENQQASVVTKETTVVVKEDDLVTASIAASFKRIGRIHEGTATSTPIVAVGSVIGSGVIVTDLSVVSGEHAVAFPAGVYRYTVSQKFPDLGIAIMTATDTKPDAVVFKASDAGSLKLGQSVIGLFGARSDRVSLSTISAQSQLASIGKEESAKAVRLIETTLVDTLTPGAPLVNIFGDLAGVSTNVSRSAGGKGGFVAFSDIAQLISSSAASTTPAE